MQSLESILKIFAAAVLGAALAGAFSVTVLITVHDRTDTALAAAALVDGRAPSIQDNAVETSTPASAAVRADPPMKTNGHGEASFYGRRFAGRETANGEVFDPDALTAAHRFLPFGSKVRVTNTANGLSVVVRVNDRGPFVGNRLIDLSRKAAERLGMIESGTARVRIELIS